MRRGLSFILAASAVTTVIAVPAASRTVRIVNKCSYDVYPAVAPFPNLPEPYKDERGWKAAPETSRDISIPGNFLGRIWGRHGCAQDGDRLNCVTGGCRDVKLACADGEMGGGATSVEFRLRTAQNGEYDVYDLNNGGGWGVPVGIKPGGKNCDSISCTPTLATCPDPKLALKDSYGQILGCASACYGGIGNSDQQCCNGAFADAAKCTPDMIQFYSYFKEPCRHAYAYYQDSRQGSPTVNYMCKAEDDPGFTVTFCPEGDGDSGPKGGATGTGTGKKPKPTGGGGGAATGNTNESGKIGEPTGTAAVTQPSNIPALSAVPILNVTSTNAAEATSQASATSESATASDEAAAPSAAPATTTSDEDATASAADASSAASESAGPEETTPGGISKTAMIGVGVGIALVAILGMVVACVVSRRKNSQPTTAAASTKSAAAQSSDPEAGHTSGPSAGAGASYNALGRAGSRRRGRQRLLSSSSESDHSSSDDLKGELYSDHSDTSRRARRSVSRRSSTRR